MILSRREILAASAFLAACAPGERRAKPGADGLMILGLDPEPLALASAGSIDAGSSIVSPKIFDRLFAFDLNAKLQPQLATAGTVSPDGRTVTLNLRPGVLWHDGKPLTSADVAFSMTEIWAKYHARSRTAFSLLDAVETPDPLTVVLRLKKPAPFIFSTLADGASQVAPRHLYEGGDILSAPNNLAPVGSGPFRFVRWERGSYVLLERNPNYWDAPRPHLKQVMFRFLGNGAAMTAALETGSVHYAGAGGGDIPLDDVARFKADPAFRVESYGPNYSAGWHGFMFNLDRPALRDPRIRHAFAHAIDKNFIKDNIWRGYALLADSPVPPGTAFHADNLPIYEFDPAKAEALLDAAGLPRGADGVRLRLRNEVMPPSAQISRSAQFIRASLAKIGVELTLQTNSLAAYLKRIFTDRDWDTATFSTGSDLDPALGIQRFYWTKTFQPGTPWTNQTHYSDPETDRLLEAGQVEIDPEKRKQIYADVQRRVQEHLPIIPILVPAAVIVANKRLVDTDLVRGDNFANARWTA